MCCGVLDYISVYCIYTYFVQHYCVSTALIIIDPVSISRESAYNAVLYPVYCFTLYTLLYVRYILFLSGHLRTEQCP